MSDVLRVLAVLGLVAANAFFVVGEYAVVTARRTALAPRAEAGSAGARAALRLMDDPVKVISTVQVGITAIGILTGAVAEPLVRHLFGDALPGWAALLLAFAIVTYLSVVLGELVPKALTLQRSEALAVVVARPIELISVVLRPAVWVLQGSASLLLRPLGIREVVAGESIRSADELRALIDEAEGAGVIPRAQEELLHNVFKFAAREARDVMIPALDVAWFDADLMPRAALDQVLEAPHERYPVGDGSLDRPMGIVHVQDLIAAERDHPADAIGPLARPALVVPVARRPDGPGAGVDVDRRRQRDARHASAPARPAHARGPGVRRARTPPGPRRHDRARGCPLAGRRDGRPAHHALADDDARREHRALSARG
jgi:putative hemolysin